MLKGYLEIYGMRGYTDTLWLLILLISGSILIFTVEFFCIIILKNYIVDFCVLFNDVCSFGVSRLIL